MATKPPKASRKPAQKPRIPLSKAFSSCTDTPPKPAEPQQTRTPARSRGFPVR